MENEYWRVFRSLSRNLPPAGGLSNGHSGIKVVYTEGEEIGEMCLYYEDGSQVWVV